MNFNPPTCKGWDTIGYGQTGRYYDFNPPTRKGWDQSDPFGIFLQPHFNPPTRKGWDCISWQSICCVKFQSTHPQGVGLLTYFAYPSGR